MQDEPLALRGAERPHPVGARHLGNAADLLEVPDEALHGVLAVL